MKRPGPRLSEVPLEQVVCGQAVAVGEEQVFEAQLAGALDGAVDRRALAEAVVPALAADVDGSPARDHRRGLRAAAVVGDEDLARRLHLTAPGP
jgi:hypothetical protein